MRENVTWVLGELEIGSVPRHCVNVEPPPICLHFGGCTVLKHSIVFKQIINFNFSPLVHDLSEH